MKVRFQNWWGSETWTVAEPDTPLELLFSILDWLVRQVKRKKEYEGEVVLRLQTTSPRYCTIRYIHLPANVSQAGLILEDMMEQLWDDCQKLRFRC